MSRVQLVVALVPVLFLGACAYTHRPACESESRTVDDDEILPDLEVTVTELFARIASKNVVPAQVLDPDRTVVEHAAVEVVTGRGQGDAIWTDSVPVDQVTTHFGIGHNYLALFVVCTTGLNAAATLDIAREDDDAALTADATLAASDDELAVGRVQVDSDEVTGEGDWSGVDGAYASYREGWLDGVQLQAGGDIVLDWR